MSNDKPSDFRLEEFLPYQLSVATNAVSNRIAQVYREEFGLTIPEWRTMAMLGDAGRLTQRQLTEGTLMDKVAVNRACKQMEERDLIVRRPNSSDGRSHLLELTGKGRQMFDRIVPLARSIEADLLRELGPDFNQQEFRRQLAQIRDFAARVGQED